MKNKTVLFGMLALMLTASLAMVMTSCPEAEIITKVIPGNAPDDGDPVVRITFNANFTGAPSVAQIRIGRGTAAGSAWPVDPVRLGYTLNGWFAGTQEYTAQTVINNDVALTAQWSLSAYGPGDQPSKEELAALFSNALPANLSDSWKVWGFRNPIITQSFSADPTVIVYNDRVYVYASNDTLLYNASGAPIRITYGEGIQGIKMFSSGDLVNWTDHGVINIAGPRSTNPLVPTIDPVITPNLFTNRSWAPTAAWKMIDGKPQFFIYYGGLNGIGVVSADSPTGPWRCPLGRYLISRDTPNCADVAWLFDPGVMVDDDGRGYLFFGGGPPNTANPGNGRRVQLGDDMISLAIDPQEWNVPYLFENSEVNRINGRNYYTYTTNNATKTGQAGLSGNYQIAYILFDGDPMGTFQAPRDFLAAPSGQLSTPDENNHGSIFSFKGEHYIAYHAAIVARAMGLGFNYRSTMFNRLTVDSDGQISAVSMTRTGVEQVGRLNPFIPNEAETIAAQGGVYTRAVDGASNGMVVTSIDTGDWLGIYGVDFGSAGATKFLARVRLPETPTDFVGGIELRLDPTASGHTATNQNLDSAASPARTTRISGGTVIGRLRFSTQPGEAGQFVTVMIDLDEPVTGEHDLVFVFYSSLGVRINTINPDARHMEGFEFDQWQFFE